MQILVYLEREWDKQQFWQEKRLDAGNLVDDLKTAASRWATLLRAAFLNLQKSMKILEQKGVFYSHKGAGVFDADEERLCHVFFCNLVIQEARSHSPLFHRRQFLSDDKMFLFVVVGAGWNVRLFSSHVLNKATYNLFL